MYRFIIRRSKYFLFSYAAARNPTPTQRIHSWLLISPSVSPPIGSWTPSTRSWLSIFSPSIINVSSSPKTYRHNCFLCARVTSQFWCFAVIDEFLKKTEFRHWKIYTDTYQHWLRCLKYRRLIDHETPKRKVFIDSSLRSIINEITEKLRLSQPGGRIDRRRRGLELSNGSCNWTSLID